MPLKKIADAPQPCQSPEHNPPTNMTLSPGTYEYSCPSCCRKIVFTVPASFCSDLAIPGDTYTQSFTGGRRSKITVAR